MSSDNPFEVSNESYGDRSGLDRDAATVEVSVRTLEMLNQTRPWVRLMGVLMWIGVVFMALASVGMAVAGLAAGQVEALGAAVIYVIFVIVYAYLARSLTTYANRISALEISGSILDLEDALEAQKNFWRLVGIITVLFLILYAVLLVLVLAGAVMLPGMMGR